MTTLTARRTRDEAAARLLTASARHALDPAVEIDWDTPAVPGGWFLAPHRSSLYGTPSWERLSEEQRRELGRHEIASIASVGIWFELVLDRILLRRADRSDPLRPSWQYALIEVGEECRHSVMFARFIDRLGCPVYGPGDLARRLGRLFTVVADDTALFAAALYVEEVLDALQREAMDDESVQPLVRQVARLHVVEEARHIRFAQTTLLGADRRRPTGRDALRDQVDLGLAVLVATRRLVHPGVYGAVGLDPRAARREALRNPHWHATLRFAAAKAVASFEEAGLVGPANRLLLAGARVV